jgi:uracil-DNA glycosylase
VVISPGSGFPTDRASTTTPVARDAAEVVRLAASAPSLAHLDGRSSVCRACPRLVAWREQVALDKRAAFAEETYWGRPVTGFGVEKPKVLVMGLAPAAHGGNRTGRIFTGDRSGDWLFAALTAPGWPPSRTR